MKRLNWLLSKQLEKDLNFDFGQDQFWYQFGNLKFHLQNFKDSTILCGILIYFKIYQLVLEKVLLEILWLGKLKKILYCSQSLPQYSI